MARSALRDRMWEQLEEVLQIKGCHRWKNDRNAMKAILWTLRTGAPWRDVPSEFFPWGRLIIDSIVGLKMDCGKIFFKLRGKIDTEWLFADGSYVRAHQHASGARREDETHYTQAKKQHKTEPKFCFLFV